MDWFTRFGAMYQLFNDTPALAHDMAMNGPQTDLAYDLARAMQTTATPIDAYPADTQTMVA
jgi:hypothetical protein